MNASNNRLKPRQSYFAISAVVVVFRACIDHYSKGTMMNTKTRARGSFCFYALLTMALLISMTATSAAQAPARPYFTEPAISPDLSEIAFVSGGDIWTVAGAGGGAHLLFFHPPHTG